MHRDLERGGHAELCLASMQRFGPLPKESQPPATPRAPGCRCLEPRSGRLACFPKIVHGSVPSSDIVTHLRHDIDIPQAFWGTGACQSPSA